MKHNISFSIKYFAVTIAFLSTVTASSAALACFVPTPEQTSPWQALVHRSANIVLAEAVSAQPADPQALGTVQLKVVQTLKGTARAQVEINEARVIPKLDPKNTDKGDEPKQQSFNDHRDKLFWQNRMGRTIAGPDCLIHPTFIAGEKYLVFADKPYHVKSFEMIRNENDEWLAKVKAEIKKSGKNPVQ